MRGIQMKHTNESVFEIMPCNKIGDFQIKLRRIQTDFQIRQAMVWLSGYEREYRFFFKKLWFDLLRKGIINKEENENMQFNTQGLVALIETKDNWYPLGYVAFNYLEKLDTQFIFSLAVHPEYRHLYVGRRMIEGLSIMSGCSLSIFAKEEDVDTCSFLTKVGFRLQKKASVLDFSYNRIKKPMVDGYEFDYNTK